MVSLETNVGSSGKTIYDQKEIQQNGKYSSSQRRFIWQWVSSTRLRLLDNGILVIIDTTLPLTVSDQLLVNETKMLSCCDMPTH